ncbi:MAG: DUF6901 family protein [Prochlorotrichaceae cyanobacterium]
MRQNTKQLDFQYIFTFEEGDQIKFDLSVNLPNLTLVRSTTEDAPDWTRLSHHQCPNCSLTEAEDQYCPMALSIQTLIHSFQDKLSFSQVTVTVITQERTYSKSLALQRGISSLMGIYMATSGCPVMEKLRPMVRYHLPFASLEETIYRAISMYLFSQYLVFKKGGEPDWEMERLLKIYQDIRVLNEHFCKRLNSLNIQDANVNAVVILNNFADILPCTLNDDLVFSIAEYFHPYLNGLETQAEGL